MSDDQKGPKFDWRAQLQYFVLMLVGIVAALALLRYLGLRG